MLFLFHGYFFLDGQIVTFLMSGPASVLLGKGHIGLI